MKGPVNFNGRWKIGRLQVGYHFYIHMYPYLSDRWVFQPFFVWDRK